MRKTITLIAPKKVLIYVEKLRGWGQGGKYMDFAENMHPWL